MVVCERVCVVVEQGRTAGRFPAKVSGWQNMCRKEDVRWPWDGEMALCFIYSGALASLALAHLEAGLGGEGRAG